MKRNWLSCSKRVLMSQCKKGVPKREALRVWLALPGCALALALLYVCAIHLPVLAGRNPLVGH